MAAFKLPLFAGMVPSIDPNLLSESNAAYCSNVWLYSGALWGLPARTPLYTMANPNSSVAFRIPTSNTDTSYIFDSFWVEYLDVNTTFIKAPVSGDTFQRYYWCSPTEVPKYNTAARLIAGQPAWLLGLPQPVTPTCALSGGSSPVVVSRAYVTTLVTAYGEEGPASTPVLVASGKLDATYTVTIGAVLAADMGTNRNVSKIRLYRTVVGADGIADYFLVTEVTALTTSQTFVDTALDATIASNVMLGSTSWSAPPALQGMITMPNGIIAGFKDKDLYFSEAYRPHAWPAAYSISLEHKIVGFGLIGQTLVICTEGNPYTATGVNPSSMTTSKLATFEPCLSNGSIVSTEQGVYYASKNGLILVNPGVAENITKQYISRDKWIEIVNSGHTNGGKFGSAYYAFGSQTQGLFQPDIIQSDTPQNTIALGSMQGFMLDPTNPEAGFSFVTAPTDVKWVGNDMISGELLVTTNGKVYWLDQSPGHGSDTYKWQSKIYQAPSLANLGAFKVYMYENPAFAYSAPQNYNLNQVFDSTKQQLIIRIYADGKLILAHECRVSGELHRLPTGFKANFWQIEFEGTVKVKNFQLASTVKELAHV